MISQIENAWLRRAVIIVAAGPVFLVGLVLGICEGFFSAAVEFAEIIGDAW